MAGFLSRIPKQWKVIAFYTLVIYLLFLSAIEYAKRHAIEDVPPPSVEGRP